MDYEVDSVGSTADRDPLDRARPDVGNASPREPFTGPTIDHLPANSAPSAGGEHHVESSDARSISHVGVDPNLPTEQIENGFALRRRLRLRQLDRKLRDLRRRISDADEEIVLVHAGPAPSNDEVDTLLTALDAPVDRGAGSRGAGHNIVRAVERPDIVLDDDGSNATVSRMWHLLVREGAHAVTTGAARDEDAVDHSAFLVRRDSIAVQRPPRPKPAWQRSSWWISVVIVTWFAMLQGFQIVTGAARGPGGAGAELADAWLIAARNGSVSDVPGRVLPGSSLWPAIARPVLSTFGTTGVRWLSLVLTVIAVGAASAASSRLFGRWAARTTAVVLAVGLWFTGIGTSVSPVPLSMAAMAISLLAIALVEHDDRRSWILLAGLAATAGVIASYPSIVFVVVLSMFFTLLRGRHGLTDSNTMRLVVAAGLLAWFLPTRESSVRFIVGLRFRADWSDLLLDTALLAAIVLAVSMLVSSGTTSDGVRRRVVVLGTSLLAVPFAHIVSGSTLADGTDISIALVLVAPALGGALAHQFARLRFGSEVVPRVRSETPALTVDPSTGQIRRRLIRYSNRQVRMAAAAVVVSSLWYLPWAAANIDWRNWWLALPFLAANAAMVGTALLSAFNNWNRAIPIPVDVAPGHEPLVGVIVPTYSEPLYMVLNTVRSIFDQDWPAERLRVVVSDDAHDDTMRDAVAAFARRLPDGALLYNRPPKKGDPARRGESKSGNLNSAVLMLHECDFVETRDADDMVGSSNFLRATVGQMMDDTGLGFIQTIKETKTSEGDPFNNNEPFFYRGTMLARNADYAIFPCGSGLVWRRSALREIDDFPVWNLVEDLHSGVLGLRAGWRGLYVPIVGAHAQHSPEDVANVFKQRGTWALDTTRLLLFDRFRGIPTKMRLHFLEQAFFYLLSFPLLVLVSVPATGLFLDRFPLDTDATTYAVHFWGFALSIELMLLSLAAAQPAGSLWRSRLSWIGMAPIYAKAAMRALWYGPNKKPAYKVTRKTDDYQWYVKLVKSHWTLLGATIIATIVALFRDRFLTELDLGSVYWAIIAMVGLGSFLRLSWFGVDARARLRAKFEPALSLLRRLGLLAEEASEEVEEVGADPVAEVAEVADDVDTTDAIDTSSWGTLGTNGGLVHDYALWAREHRDEAEAAERWLDRHLQGNASPMQAIAR